MKKIIFVISLICSISLSSAKAQTLKTVNGVHTITYNLDEGNIYIYLPEKIVRGKMISGTFYLEPKGKSDREKARNREKLGRYRVKMHNAEIAPSGKLFTINNPPDAIEVGLSTFKEKQIGQSRIIFNAKPELPAESSVRLPTHIANDVNTSFYGPFDGSLANTSVKGNGKPLNIVAESPVQICLRPSNLNTTSTNIQIRDGSNTHTGQCNSIYYTLKVGPTNLKRGQSTFFDATVHGVGTIDKPLTYKVVNGTPSIVSLGGGNTQTFTINPGEGEGGNWHHHFDIQSLSSGSFLLNTELIVPDTEYPGGEVLSGEVEVKDPSFEVSPPGGQISNPGCNIDNGTYYFTPAECEALGGKPVKLTYSVGGEEVKIIPNISTVTTKVALDENEATISLNLENGDRPEMILSTITPANNPENADVKFLTSSENKYKFYHKNPNFGKPSAATIETKLLYSNGSTQTVNNVVNFTGNPFYSIAQSPELSKIRNKGNGIKNGIKTAQGSKSRLETERNNTQSRYNKARKTYLENNSQFRYLWKIDQSLEKVRPAFTDSLKILVGKYNEFKKRTGGAPGKANKQMIDENLRDAKKAHEDCMNQLGRLQQEQTDLTNEKETLKEQQKQLHRNMMDLFRSTGMDFAGSTRRDKNGVFHYQYGVVTVSGSGVATYHKGSVPAQIASKISSLEKQMKQTTDRLKTVSERLNNLPGEIKAKNKECDELGEKAGAAQDAKNKADALAAEDQFWNNKMDALCAKIMSLLNRLKTWAGANDPALLARINNVKCGENIFDQIDGVISRKKVLETGFEGKASNARREMGAAGDKIKELDDKIKVEEDKIRAGAVAFAENQKKEAEAAAKALSADQQKCNEMLENLGYKGDYQLSPADVYEISQDVKKAADEANEALNHLTKVVELGEDKMKLDPGKARELIKNTQDRLKKIAEKLGKIAEYKETYDKIMNVVNELERYNSDGSAVQNAEAFGAALDHIKLGLDKLTDKFPVLKAFTAYFEFIVGSYHAIMKGANDAVRTQYKKLLSDVKGRMNCDKLLRVCKTNGDDLQKVIDWAYYEFVEKPGFDGLRYDQTHAKEIIAEITKQKLAECCFKRLQAINAATGN